MAPRSTKSTSTASLAFGLVNIPVGTYSAVADHDRKANSYHLHEDGSYSRISAPFICNDCGESCRSDTVKGYEADDGSLVLVTKDELESIDTGAGKDYEITEFVDANFVSPLLLETPYYVVPRAEVVKGGKKVKDPKRAALTLQSYTALRNQMVEKDVVGIAQYSSRGKTHRAMLRVWDDILVIQNIRWPDELRDHDFEILDQDVKVDPRLAKMAGQAIEALRGEFNDDDYTDIAQQELAELIEAKAAGGEWVAPAAEGDEEVDDEIGDLLAKFEASIEAGPKTKAGSKARHPAKGEAAKRKTAAKTA